MRRIVYLDHSVLSILAKGDAQELLTDLTALVDADQALFPFSWTHHSEAELDDRLRDLIYELGATLSRGVRFRPNALIVAEQAKWAYRRFRGETAPVLDLTDAFHQDPRGALGERLGQRMRGARVLSGSAELDTTRAVKNLFAQSLSQTRRVRRPGETFDEAKKRYAVEAVDIFFAEPWHRGFQGDWSELVVAMQQFGSRVADEALGLGRPPLEAAAGIVSFFEFFSSPFCRDIPFIELHSSILASLEVDERSRPYSPSDFHDVQTWSTYLPYVDLAVADSQMCAVLNRRNLAAAFGCTVFPNTEAGRRNLVTALGSPG